MNTPARVVAFLSLLAVLAFVLFQGRDPSPGPLAAVHAREVGLAGLGGCDACHGSGSQDMAAACASCHPAIAAQAAARTGIHGSLEAAVLADCGSCHVEHHGEEARLVDDAVFARVGIEELARYDHRHVADPLHGAHEALACEVCHTRASEQPLSAGGPRFLGLDGRCSSCHDDPHGGELPGCEACHGQLRPFAEVAAFEHDAEFPLVGGHAGLACSACHPTEGPSSLAALTKREGSFVARGCGACHDSPHEPGFVAAAAAASARPDPQDACALCHALEHPSWREADVGAARRWHGASGFELAAPHAGLDCAACHPDTASDPAAVDPAAVETPAARFAARYPGRAAEDCGACHGDPHAGQFASGPFATARCLDCHAAEEFRPARFEAVQHERTAFPLEGAHLRAACTDCHPPDPSGAIERRVFAAAPQDCASCHADPHRGQFAAVDPKGSNCALCHRVDAFHPSTYDRERHASAAFALEGRHAELECTACHPAQAPTAAPGDRVFVGTPQRCEACHADPHGGQFREPRSGATDCASCHDVRSFERSAFTQADHARTQFPLEGAHLAVACELCHVPTGAEGPPPFRGVPTACSACHADVHAGRFDRPGVPTTREGRSDCARCHSTESFRGPVAAFDHGSWTGFALVGRHARARCEDCHPVDPSPRAERRLGVAPARCDECHADPHAGQFRKQGAVDCARCHEASASRFALRGGFDHDRDTAFQLDASHAALACSACHLPYSVAGGAQVVRYRPLGKRCQDCHSNVTGRKGGPR